MPIFFGTPSRGQAEPSFFPFTMSNFLSTASTACDRCTEKYYNKTLSSTSSFPEEIPENLVNRTVGPNYYEEGYMGKDRVCFPRTTEGDLCATDVELMEVIFFDGWQ